MTTERPLRRIFPRVSVALLVLAVLAPLLADRRAQTTPPSQAAPAAPPARDSDRAFPPEALREDLRVLWDILDEGHAGLARYTSWKVLRDAFDETEAGLTAPLTEDGFYLRLLPLVALIKDGHTRTLQSKAVAEALLARPVYFPFGLRFAGGKAYLFRNLSAARDVPDGSELLAVNGLSVDEALARLLPLVPADAGISIRKIRTLEYPAYLGELLGLLLGRPETYTIRFRPYPGGDVRERSAPGIKGTEIAKLLGERYPGPSPAPPLYDLSFRGETAVLRIRSFVDSPGRDKGIPAYPEFIRQAFQTLDEKKTPTLVIDLRDNGGGQDAYGKLLFAHVADGPFQYYKSLEMKRDAYDLFRFTDERKEAIESLPKMLRKNARGWYDVLYHPNNGTQQPQAPRFAGKVAILINAGSFSATGETTSLFHYHRKAVFFGEECGAGYYGNTSGFMALATLPNTKIRARVPLVLYTMAVDGYPPDRGLVPDVAVEPTIEDLLAGRDPALDRALEYLAAQNKHPGGIP
jgi:hypothetical protein